MTIIQTTLADTIDEFRINTNNLSTIVGDGSNLPSGYTSVVAAIQALDTEFNTNVGSTDAILAVKSVLSGAFDWDMDLSGGTTTEPASLIYSSGTKRVKTNLTWTSGSVATAVYQYSSNSGGTYNTVLTETISYTDGDVTGITWS